MQSVAINIKDDNDDILFLQNCQTAIRNQIFYLFPKYFKKVKEKKRERKK